MDLLFRQLNTDYFSNMYFNTSLGFNSRDCCCCCAATWASHLFLVSFTHWRSHHGFRGVHGASSSFARLEFQTKSVSFIYLFFSRRWDAVFTTSGSYSFCWHTSVLISTAFTFNSLHQSFYVCLTAGFSARKRRWWWRCCFGSPALWAHVLKL